MPLETKSAQKIENQDSLLRCTYLYCSAWIHDRLDPIVRKMTYRITLLTGLNTNLKVFPHDAEELQVNKFSKK